eukprot:COSAG04_NODE_91_length_26852_cov_8.609315_2_plen_49_part_00
MSSTSCPDSRWPDPVAWRCKGEVRSMAARVGLVVFVWGSMHVQGSLVK